MNGYIGGHVIGGVAIGMGPAAGGGRVIAMTLTATQQVWPKEGGFYPWLPVPRTLTKTVTRALSATLGTSATLSAARRYFKTLTATLSTTKTITQTKRLFRTLVATSTIVETLLYPRRLNRTLTATSKATVTLSLSKVRRIMLTASTASTAALRRMVGKTLTRSVATTPGIRKAVGKTLPATLTMVRTLTLGKWLTKTLTAGAVATATIGLFRGATITLFASCGLSAVIDTRMAYHLTLAAVAVLVPLLGRLKELTLAAATTMLGGLGMTPGRILTATVGTLATVNTLVGKLLVVCSPLVPRVNKLRPVTLAAQTLAIASLHRGWLLTLEATIGLSATLGKVTAFAIELVSTALSLPEIVKCVWLNLRADAAIVAGGDMTREIHMRLHARQCQRACMKRGIGINLWCWTTVEAVLAPLASLSMTLEAATGTLATMDKLARLTLSLCADAFTLPSLTKSITKRLTAKLPAKARMTKTGFIVLRAVSAVSAGMSKRLSAMRSLVAVVATVSVLEKARRLVLTLATTSGTVAWRSVVVCKGMVAKAATRARLTKARFVTLFASLPLAQSLAKRLSARRTLAAGVEAVPTMEHFRRVVVTLAATLPTAASKAVTIGKRLAVKVKAKPTLNRLWGMTLTVAVAMRPSLIVQFNQRVLADLARRVIAPLRRDKLKP